MFKILNFRQDRKIVPALFQHIQKTAGTSIVEITTAHYGKRNCISHGDFTSKKPKELAHMQFVSGHFGYDYAKSLMPERYCFTFLRDPVERILSLYYFFRANDPDTFPMYRIAHKHKLADFLRMGLADKLVRSRIWNNQVWQLACGWGNLSQKGIDGFSPNELLDLAKVHLDEFSHVGFTESFDEDMSIIANALGITLPMRTVKSNSVSRPKFNDLNDDERSLLVELTELDRQLYDYAKEQRISISGEHSN